MTPLIWIAQHGLVVLETFNDEIVFEPPVDDARKLAFLPQFIAPTDPAVLKSLWLAGVHFVIANLWQISVALMVGGAGRWLARPRVACWMEGITGSVMVLLGARLALGR